MTDKSILITGCSSGIGRDAALTLHQRGWQVLATCRNPKDCKDLIDQGLSSYVLDYASDESVNEGAKQALDLTNGRLFALFNNGAYAIPGAVEDLPRDALRAIFETNLFGQFDLINRLLPAFRAHQQGRIVNCSSVLGLTAMPFRGAYNATKFAMEGLTDTLRLELHGSGVYAVLIEPGPINTRIRENSVVHFEHWIDWENSAHKQRYKKKYLPRLYRQHARKDRFELAPGAVTQKLIHALEQPRPRARYYVTAPTYAAGFLKRILSTNALDRITR